MNSYLEKSDKIKSGYIIIFEPEVRPARESCHRLYFSIEETHVYYEFIELYLM